MHRVQHSTTQSFSVQALCQALVKWGWRMGPYLRPKSSDIKQSLTHMWNMALGHGACFDHNQSNVPIIKCLSLTVSNMLLGKTQFFFWKGPMTQVTPFPATSMIRSQIHYILSLFAKFKVTRFITFTSCGRVSNQATTSSTSKSFSVSGQLIFRKWGLLSECLMRWIGAIFWLPAVPRVQSIRAGIGWPHDAWWFH